MSDEFDFERENVNNAVNDSGEINQQEDIQQENNYSGEKSYDNDEEIILEGVPVNNTDDFKDKKDNHKKTTKKVALIVAAAILFGVISGAVGALTNVSIRKFANSRINIGTTGNVLTKSDSPLASDEIIADIVDDCMPSIVSISNKSVTDVMTFFGAFQQENISSGSGIIIGKNDTELLVVTNYHVVADSHELSVIFTDKDNPVLNGDDSMQQDMGKLDNKNILEAKVKGFDSDKDLAVVAVKLDSISDEIINNIKIAKIGDSQKLRAGERVIAIGNALGYGQSVTTGIVSATNRSVTLESQTAYGETVVNKFIQTDAAINPGNSGGALLNMNGELVGINSVKIAVNGVEGMGYAIPISDVESIIGELMIRETREVVDEEKQGFLGVTINDVTAETSKMYNMPQGIFVSSVSKGSAADKAGIKEGNIITKFDGYTVKSGAELQNRLTYYKAGETKKITVQVMGAEGYEEKEFDITLDSKKERSKIMEEEQKQEQKEDK